MAKNEVINEKFKYNSPEFEVLLNWLEPAKKGIGITKFMTTTQIMEYLNLKQSQVNYVSSVVLGKSLMRAGFAKSKKLVKKNSIYGYYVRELDN